MIQKKTSVSSGVAQLDQLLGGLFIGDNVLWYDDAGSLASLFSMKFIQASQNQKKPLIYVSFDRSPKNLLDLLGPLAESQYVTILDCFTHGKGSGSAIFNKFYEKDGAQWPHQIIRITEPDKPDQVMDAVYNLHSQMKGDVRFVFESLTGMQNLWGGEEHILKLYTHACPRLYELDTIAYWVIEKGTHSNRLSAHINQIAQVAIDLTIKRGKSSLTIVKAEKRSPRTLNKPHNYWNDGLQISFEGDKRIAGRIDLGMRLKALRTQQGVSQKELAGLVGVTPSSISQIESNQIYPSLPALFKMAEVLSVEVGSFFQKIGDDLSDLLFSIDGGVNIHFPELPKGSISGRLLSPVETDTKADIYLIEIPARKKLPSHFFTHKKEEFGYVLSGDLTTTIKNKTHSLGPGNIIYISNDPPQQWQNRGDGVGRMIWVNLK